MGDIVDLRGRSIPIEDDEFIENLARFADGTLSEAAVKAKYRLSKEEWAALGTNDTLVELVEACKLRRIRSGKTKNERAQIEVVDAPPILGSIMRDANASPRHRVDAIKTLDTLAANGPESAPATDRFVITINLGADTLRFDKSIAINPNDVDPNEASAMPRVPFVGKKTPDDDNGGHL
jgi:hypothetical protein